VATTDRHLIIAVEESDSTVGFYDSATLQEVGRIEVGFWPHELEVSTDGRTAYVTNFGVKDYDEQIGRPGWSVSVIDVPARCEARRLYTFREPFQFASRRAPHGVKLTPDGRQLFVNVENEPRMLVFDLTGTATTPERSFALQERTDRSAFTGPDAVEPSLEYPLPEGTHNFLFDAAGTTLFVVAGHGGLSAVDPLTGKVGFTKVFTSPQGEMLPVRGVTSTPDGRHLIASLRNELRILDPRPGGFEELRVLDDLGRGLGVGQLLYSEPTKPGPDGLYEIIAPAVWQSQVVFVDAATGAVTGRVHTGLDPIHVALSPDGTRAYVTHGRSLYISVIDVKARALVDRIRTRGGPNGIAVAPYSAVPPRKQLFVGACLPLTGAFGTEGREIRIGYEYWCERVNAAGGILVGGVPHDVETVVTDIGDLPPSSPEIAARARRLIADHGVTALLGTYPSPAHVGYAKVAEEAKLPLVIATGAGTDIYHPDFRFVFGIMSPARLYLAGTIEVVAKLVPRDRPTVAFLSCDDFAAHEDAVATVRFAVERGFTVHCLDPSQVPPPFRIEYVAVHPPGGGSIDVPIVVYPDRHGAFEPLLSKMANDRDLDLDLCLATGHLGESVALVAQSARVGFRPRAFGLSVGPPIATFRGEVVRHQASPEYLFGAAQWTDQVPVVGQDPFATPGEFARAFFERFSMKASYFSAGAFACGLVLHEAIRRAGTLDGTALAGEIRSLDIETFFARIRFDAQGLNSTKRMYTIQLRARGAEFDEVILWPPQGGVWPRPGTA
jgi:YVTN family beta-propeller protein